VKAFLAKVVDIRYTGCPPLAYVTYLTFFSALTAANEYFVGPVLIA